MYWDTSLEARYVLGSLEASTGTLEARYVLTSRIIKYTIFKTWKGMHHNRWQPSNAREEHKAVSLSLYKKLLLVPLRRLTL